MLHKSPLVSFIFLTDLVTMSQDYKYQSAGFPSDGVVRAEGPAMGNHFQYLQFYIESTYALGTKVW